LEFFIPEKVTQNQQREGRKRRVSGGKWEDESRGGGWYDKAGGEGG